MSPTPTDQPAARPLPAAVVDAMVEELIKLVDDGGHTDLGAFGLVETMQQLEAVRNKLPVIDRALIQHGTEQGAPGVLSQRSMVGVVMTGLRLSAGEASRRVKAAEHLADRHSQLGEPLDPIRGHLAQAQRDGAVTPEQVALIDGTLRKVKHCDPAAVEAGEVLLVQQATPARVQGPAAGRSEAGRGNRPGPATGPQPHPRPTRSGRTAGPTRLSRPARQDQHRARSTITVRTSFTKITGDRRRKPARGGHRHARVRDEFDVPHHRTPFTAPLLDRRHHDTYLVNDTAHR